MASYDTLLQVEVDRWSDGYGVVQVVSEKESDSAEIRFCYYNVDGENERYVNRPLTIQPGKETTEQTINAVEKLGFVARNFSPDEIQELKEELGSEEVIEIAQLIDTVGESKLRAILESESE